MHKGSEDRGTALGQRLVHRSSTYPSHVVVRGWSFLLVVLLAACGRDYPATADVIVTNDLPMEMTLSLCTSSCAPDDLQERRLVVQGGATTVTVNGDPSFSSAYIIEAEGTRRCLIVSSARANQGVRVSSATTVGSTRACRPPNP